MSLSKGSHPIVKAGLKHVAKVPKGAGTTGNGAKPPPSSNSLKGVARVPHKLGSGSSPHDRVSGRQPKAMAMAGEVSDVRRHKNSKGGSSSSVGGWNGRRAGKKK
jgi:hypothetical protein